MILMINGPFGVGKTSVAARLTKALPNAMLYDPEEVGYMLRSIVTEEVMHDSERTQDFQDLNLWRQLVVEVAGRLVKEYDRDLIVPMTLCNPDYFRYIRNGFERISTAVFHFCLTADYGTIHARLTKRGDAPGSWAFRQTERCLKAYAENPALFETILPTDGLSEDEVCRRILEGIRKCGKARAALR